MNHDERDPGGPGVETFHVSLQPIPQWSGLMLTLRPVLCALAAGAQGSDIVPIDLPPMGMPLTVYVDKPVFWVATHVEDIERVIFAEMLKPTIEN